MDRDGEPLYALDHHPGITDPRQTRRLGSIAMQLLPFELRYDLTRRQRLIPHLRIWRPFALMIIVSVAGSAWAVVYRGWWYLALLLPLLFIFRGFFIGFLNVLLVGRQHMDIVVEQNGLGFLAGKERWYIALDGLTSFDELAEGVWTVQHWNGSVVHIPAELLSMEQVEFFRNWVIEADAIRRRLGIDRPNSA
jgi:hypothetical protein